MIVRQCWLWPVLIWETFWLRFTVDTRVKVMTEILQYCCKEYDLVISPRAELHLFLTFYCLLIHVGTYIKWILWKEQDIAFLVNKLFVSFLSFNIIDDEKLFGFKEEKILWRGIRNDLKKLGLFLSSHGNEWKIYIWIK